MIPSYHGSFLCTDIYETVTKLYHVTEGSESCVCMPLFVGKCYFKHTLWIEHLWKDIQETNNNGPLKIGEQVRKRCFHLSFSTCEFTLPIFQKWICLLKILGQSMNTNKIFSDLDGNSGLNFFLILIFLYDFFRLLWPAFPFEALFSFLKWFPTFSFLFYS